MDEAIELGVAAYVKKPFLPEKIKAIMLEVLMNAYTSRIEEIEPEDDAGEIDDDMDF